MKHLFYILALGWVVCLGARAQNWQPTSAPNSYYDRAAMSADGTTQFVLSYLFYSYFLSTNSGGIWTSNQEAQVYPQSSYNNVAMSANGSIVLAAGLTNWLYVSTNSGVSWYSNTVPGVWAWGGVACSADGGKLYAAQGASTWPAGPIYTSTNLGVSWNLTGAPTNDWVGLASSADGNKLVAVSGNFNAGVICTSTNAGATWSQAMIPSNYWVSVASSADGTHLVAANFKESFNVPGHIYTSADSGLTWKSNGVPSAFFWSVAMSADGSRMLAGASPGSPSGNTYFSADFGATWSTNNIPSGNNNLGMAMSADGGILLAAPSGGQLYEARSIVSPVLHMTQLGQNSVLGWTAPSTNFVLQQSVDLKAWAAVTNVPVLNLTNLQEQVAITATNGPVFYRLTTP